MQDGLAAALATLGLIAPGEAFSLEPLAGGVSSDIHCVTTASGRRFCIKQALKRLKVAALWEAPVERNAAEATYFRAVARWLPDRVPALLGEDRASGLFAMAFLPPERFPLWKTALLDAPADAAFAGAVGHVLAAIHARSAAEPELAAGFDHAETFEQIRLEPYLRATARQHPDLADRLDGLIARTRATRLALVHGDISPKNILQGPNGPVFLDAECATWGDPAFDLAFCLNHLLLKGARRPDFAASCAAAFMAMVAAYRAGITWEPADACEARAATLLPALLLARIDGKSPVDYLGSAQRQTVRAAARRLLRAGPARLADFADLWSRADA